MTRAGYKKHEPTMMLWRDGAKVQVRMISGEWQDIENPSWDEDTEYRLKPKVPIIATYEHSEGFKGVRFTPGASKQTYEFIELTPEVRAAVEHLIQQPTE